MGLMSSVLESFAVLKQNSETWLEFSAGQNTETNLARFTSGGHFEFPLQVLRLAKLWIVGTRLRRVDASSGEVLFFCSTQNQFSVLEPLVTSDPEYSYTFVVSPTFRAPKIGATLLDRKKATVNLWGFFQVLVLTCIRVPVLLFALFNKNPLLVRRRFMSFCASYYWLVCHQKLLEEVRPKLVVLANDHNPECRTLIELCKRRSIETAYVPHATVSTRFHALEFNHSFLDGQNALDIYKLCEQRRSVDSPRVKNRRCYIVGGLRRLQSAVANPEAVGDALGLAVKGTDEIGVLSAVLHQLDGFGQVILRPHPNLSGKYLTRLARFAANEGLLMSDPSIENAGAFLGGLKYLISGNSTLLLEAASLGKVPIYLNDMSGGVDDYYGFVRRGVCLSCREVGDLRALLVLVSKSGYEPSRTGLRYFIGSFGEFFEGKEPSMVNNLILNILNEDRGSVGRSPIVMFDL